MTSSAIFSRNPINSVFWFLRFYDLSHVLIRSSTFALHLSPSSFTFSFNFPWTADSFHDLHVLHVLHDLHHPSRMRYFLHQVSFQARASLVSRVGTSGALVPSHPGLSKMSICSHQCLWRTRQHGEVSHIFVHQMASVTWEPEYLQDKIIHMAY